MEHFYQNIQGWFSYQSLYKQVIDTFDSGHFVEVGSWRGRSSSFMAVEIHNSGKQIKFDCVDTWKGTPDEQEHQTQSSVVNDTLYDEFLENTKLVKHIINAVRMTSEDASKMYDDNSLDFVLIDAGHSYEDVSNDIKHWLPKVKVGGIIAGDDYAPNWPGVQKAVDELLPQSIKSPNYYWYYEVK